MNELEALLVAIIALIMFVALPYGIYSYSSSNRTTMIEGKYLEGVQIAGTSYRVTKASYVVNGVTHIWTGADGKTVTSPVANVTPVTLFYDEDKPESASFYSDETKKNIGLILMILSVMVWISVLIYFREDIWRFIRSLFPSKK